MNTQIFEMEGIAIPLDLDSLSVDRRVTEAMTKYVAWTKTFAQNRTQESIVRDYVNAMRDCVAEMFDNPQAPEIIFGELDSLKAIVQRFQDTAAQIGRMRGEVMKQANTAIMAANAATILGNAEGDQPPMQNVRPYKKPRKAQAGR